MINPEPFIIAVIGGLTGSGIASIIIAVLQRRWAVNDKKSDELKAVTDALKILMIDKVRADIKDAVHDGAITPNRRDEIKEAHQAYKALGGNGHLDNDMKVLSEIPTKYE